MKEMFGKGFKAEDHEQMLKVERAVLDAIRPFQNGRTEAALVSLALMRIARTLINLYPRETQAQLVPVFTAFIQGRSTAPGVDAGLVIPS